ncbi:MAG: hypothetical protein K0S99_1415 [Thermomicrobiales bacterium]|nr:hypothetical protein [Thermomicrobiales bacterium]
MPINNKDRDAGRCYEGFVNRRSYGATRIGGELMSVLDPPLQARVTRGNEGIAWIGDSLTASGSTTPGIVLTTSSSVGATSITVNHEFPGYPALVAPLAGNVLVIDPGNATEEHVSPPAVSGRGPYTATVPALTYAHASGAVVRSEPHRWNTEAIPMWVNILSNGRLRHAANWAHGGWTSAQLRAAYASVVIARKPAAYVVAMGTNDYFATSAITNDIVPLWKQLLSAGILPIAQTVPPSSAYTTSSSWHVVDFNARLVYEACKLGIPCHDAYSAVVEPGPGTNGAGGWTLTYNKDGSHHSELGARAWAQSFSLFASAMNGIRDVHKACAEIDLDQALARSAMLAEVLDRIESTAPDGEPGVFHSRRTTGTHMDITPSLIPSDAVRKLHSVVRGDANRASLWSRPHDTSPLPLDPTTIRERFHRDQRGVQVLTAWMSEGGGTPRVVEVVNKLIAEDGDIQPLITGLINTSALLATVAAGALGTSPQGLVGSLLDRYGPFGQSISDEWADVCRLVRGR